MNSVLFVLLAYLIGSVSFAVVVTKLMRLPDPRTYGSHNPGATNVLRSGNKTAALLTLLGDALKGYVAVMLAKHFAPQFSFGEPVIAAVALAALLGHMLPLFHAFKGGKGVATAIGILFAVQTGLAVGVMIIWLLVFYFSRMSSLASICGAVVAPLLGANYFGFGWMTLSLLIMALLIIYRHRENIGKLMHGEESRFSSTRRDKS
jgi:acyl phosphate:glycerol-3-phosphate acyltransferase